MQPLLQQHPSSSRFGLSERSPWNVYWDELRPLLEDGLEDELRARLDALGDNVQCVAWRLLDTVCSMLLHERKLQSVSDEILRDLLRRDLPQEELLYFFWRCLVEKHCGLDVIRIICETRRELLHLHLDLRDCELYPLFSGPPMYQPSEDQDPIVGFPLMCLALNYLPDKHSECLERMQVLLELGADVNARHCDEPTPVQVAAERGAWDVVQFLLQHGADIDIRIGDVTTRDVISRTRPELVCDIPEKSSPPSSPLNLFYDALYSGDETRFSELLQENSGVDLNVHNGRETLLQLAVRQQLVKSMKELVKRGADINQMAGLCAQPILLALENPECDCLKFLTKQKDKLKLRFTRDGGTFLHALGRVKYESTATLRDVFRALIDEALQQEVNVHARDNDDETALEVLCLQKDPTIFHLTLDHVGLYAVSSSVVQKTPPDVFVKYFDEKIVYREQGNDMEENVNIGFDFLKLREATTTEARAAEMLPFYEMSKSKEYAKTVLLHPVVLLFLIYKWRQIAYVYILYFIIYLIFSILLSVYINEMILQFAADDHVETNDDADDPRDIIFTDVTTNNYNYAIFTHAITCVFWSLILFREIFRMKVSFRNYIRRPENLFQVLVLASSFLTFIPPTNKYRFILATAITLTYIELTLLIGRHPSTGTYVTMFLRVTGKSLRLLLTFSSFIFAFSFSFFVLYYNNNAGNNPFSDIWYSLLRTMGIAVGELNIDEMLKSNSFEQHSMFLIFLILVTVVLMNLLNALAVSDTQSVINEAEMICCVDNVKHFTRIESMLLGYDPENCAIEDRIRGFNLDKNRIFSGIKSYLSQIAVPFQPCEVWWCFDCGPSNLVVHQDTKNYYPHLYVCSKSSKLKRMGRYLLNFYNRKFLHCNEDTVLDEIFMRLKFPKPSEHLETKCLTELRNTFQKMQLDLKNYKKSQKLERIKSEELQQEMVNTFQSIKSDFLAELRSTRSQMTKELNEIHEVHLAEIKLLHQAQLAQFKSLFPPELQTKTAETTP